MPKPILLFTILVFLAFGIAFPAFADDTIRIATLEISVWPEYDQPGVLVQYQGQLAGANKSGATREISVLCI